MGLASISFFGFRSYIVQKRKYNPTYSQLFIEFVRYNWFYYFIGDDMEERGEEILRLADNPVDFFDLVIEEEVITPPSPVQVPIVLEEETDENGMPQIVDRDHPPTYEESVVSYVTRIDYTNLDRVASAVRLKMSLDIVVRTYSVANLDVVSRWVQKELAGPDYASMRDKHKRKVLELVKTLAFVPSEEEVERVKIMNSSAVQDRMNSHERRWLGWATDWSWFSYCTLGAHRSPTRV
jgi:hypothetical protein